MKRIKIWRVTSFGLWLLDAQLKFTDISKEYTASIWRVEDTLIKLSFLLHSYSLLISISSTLKMEAVCSSGMCEFYLSAPYHNPDGSSLYNYRFENLRSDTELQLFAVFEQVPHRSLTNLILALLNCKFLIIYRKNIPCLWVNIALSRIKIALIFMVVVFFLPVSVPVFWYLNLGNKNQDL
jgi:hypothetical protein